MTKVVGLLHESPVSSLSVEVDLSDFFQVCKTRGKGRQGEKAQEFTDMLDEVRPTERCNTGSSYHTSRFLIMQILINENVNNI